MPLSRRNILGLIGASFCQRLFAGTFVFEVDRLVSEGISVRQPSGTGFHRRYRANATITLLSIPLVSKSGVGSGYTLIEEVPGSGTDATTVAIQFGAGSWPESARGLNRLGYIQEVVFEKHPGQLAECAYFAFMTTSQEKSLDQARKALETSSASIPYSAAEGAGRAGSFASRLDRVSFPAELTWKDCDSLVRKVREAVASEAPAQRVRKDLSSAETAPATFLYSVRKAILDPKPRTEGSLIYNGKEFTMRCEKEADPAVGARFLDRNLVGDASKVIRLSALLHDKTTGVQTPFKVWYEAGFEHLPPLRFEYQAKSFLRLTFEADSAVAGPEIRPLLNSSMKKELA